MSLTSLLVHDVTIITPGTTTDAYGDTQPDWTTSTTSTVKGWLAQTSSIENLDGRDATITTLALTLPAAAPIGPRDRVSIDGIVYELTGAPISAWTRRGEHHIECSLGLVIG